MLVSIGGLLKTSPKFLGLSLLLQKDVPLVFDHDCVEEFEIHQKALISAPIV